MKKLRTNVLHEPLVRSFYVLTSLCMARLTYRLAAFT